MSDELDSKVDIRDYAPDSQYGETLLYDFANARNRNRARPSYLPLFIKAANFFLGVGVGGFMVIWLDSLK